MTTKTTKKRAATKPTTRRSRTKNTPEEGRVMLGAQKPCAPSGMTEPGDDHVAGDSHTRSVAPGTTDGEEGPTSPEHQIGCAPSPSHTTPPDGHSPCDDQTSFATGGDDLIGEEGHEGSEPLCDFATSPTTDASQDGADRVLVDDRSTLVRAVREGYLRYRATQRLRIQQRNGILAFIRMMLGYHGGPAGKMSDAIKADSDAVWKHLTKGKPLPDHISAVVVESVRGLISDVYPAHQTIMRCEAKAGRVLVALAEQLPASEWVQRQTGFGLLNFACIIGEAGDLDNYANPGKLWKRMGLAVVNGHAQGKPGPNATAQDWKDHGYNPARRAVMFNVRACLIKATSPGWYEMYRKKKAKWQVDNGIDPDRRCGHASNHAGRLMEKQVLLHLWKQWRIATGTYGKAKEAHRDGQTA